MITLEKIETYKRFGGDTDGFSRSRETAEIEDEEWWLIGELLSALHLVEAGKASAEFAQSTEEKLHKSVADENSREELRKLSKAQII